MILGNTVNFLDLEGRDGIRYLINEKTPFSGVAVKTSETGEITRLKSGVSPPNRSKTLIRNFSPVQELGIKDFLAVFS